MTSPARADARLLGGLAVSAGYARDVFAAFGKLVGAVAANPPATGLGPQKAAIKRFGELARRVERPEPASVRVRSNHGWRRFVSCHSWQKQDFTVKSWRHGIDPEDSWGAYLVPVCGHHLLRGSAAQIRA